MTIIPEGTTGTVVSFFERKSKFGTWTYSQTAIVRRDDGTTFRADLGALRLDEEIDPAKIELAARDRSDDVYSLFRTAGLSLVSRHNSLV